MFERLVKNKYSNKSFGTEMSRAVTFISFKSRLSNLVYSSLPIDTGDKSAYGSDKPQTRSVIRF